MRTLLLLAFVSGCTANAFEPRTKFRAIQASAPPMGWNNFYNTGCGSSFTQSYVITQANALVSRGLAAAGYRIVDLDDCWMGASRTNGHLTPTANFSNGITSLCSSLHALGLSCGTYADAGYQTCDLAAGTGMPNGGGAGFYTTDANDFASWGVDYVKFDGCGVYQPTTTIAIADNGLSLPRATIKVASSANLIVGDFYVTSSGGAQTVTCTGVSAGQLTGCTGGTGTTSSGATVAQSWVTVFQSAYSQMRAAMTASGRRMQINASIPAYFQHGASSGLSGTSVQDWFTVLGWIGPYAQSWRLGDDIGLPFVQGVNRWADPNASNRGVYANYLYTSRQGRYSKPGNWNDPDYLLGGEGLTLDETKSQTALWAVMGAPLFLSFDVVSAAQNVIDVYTNPRVIAVDQLGRQGYLVYVDTNVDVLIKRMTQYEWAIAIFNHDSASHTVTTTLDQLGWPIGTTISVEDEWTGTVTASIPSPTLSAHGTALYKITTAVALMPTGIVQFFIDGFSPTCLTWDGTDQYLRNEACSASAYRRFYFPGDSTVRLNNPIGGAIQCMDFDGSSPPKVILASCTGSTQQKWTYAQNGALVNQSSGLCLDMTNEFQLPTVPLQMQACSWHGGGQTMSAPFAQ